MTTDNDRVGSSGDFINIFNGDTIDFVVDVQALDIFSVSFNNIDELINSDIFSQKDISVMDLILVQDISNHSLIKLFV